MGDKHFRITYTTQRKPMRDFSNFHARYSNSPLKDRHLECPKQEHAEVLATTLKQFLEKSFYQRQKVVTSVKKNFRNAFP